MTICKVITNTFQPTQLYEKELEKVFNFNDVMQNIPIVKPDNDISDDDSSSDEEDEDKESRHRVGFFKVSFLPF